MRDLAEMAADGLDRQAEQPSRQRGKYDSDQHARPVRQQAPNEENQGGRAHANGECGRADGGQCLSQHRKLRQQMSGFGTGQCEPTEIPELAGKDHDRDTAAEANGYGMRDIANERTKPQQADQGQHESGEEDCQQQPVETEFGDGSRDENDEGAGGTADLITAAAQRRDQKAADDRGI